MYTCNFRKKKIQNGEGYWHVNQLVMPQTPQNKVGFSAMFQPFDKYWITRDVLN